jgi:hypothetical protein
VPGDDGIGLHDDEDVRPAGPKTPEGRPEKSVQAVQFWTWPFPLEHGYLLSECENLEGGIATTAEEDPDGKEE